jgi:oxygen-independent coproporphyrinogen-3 oxidase
VNYFFPKRDNNLDIEKNLYINIFSNKDEILIDGELENIKISKKDIFEDEKAVKNAVKRVIYTLLSKYTNTILPWGILTGIRPAKLALVEIENNINISDEEILDMFENTYLVSKEKALLATNIARKEYELLSEIDYKNGYSLYIGIPFCPTTCLYCSFTSYSLEKYGEKREAYLEALIKEIKEVSKILKGKKLSSVYMGGGTPTTLTPLQMDILISSLKENFDIKDNTEITVEAGRPDSINEEKLRVLKKHNIKRISINPQTMNEETLNLIGRKHSVREVIDSFNLARSLGFDNINMDFILGLPGEDINAVKNTMEEIIKLDPDSITIHSLAIKRAAGLSLFKEKYKDLSIENNKDIMDLCYNYAEKMNMQPYYMYRQKNMAGNLENVGFSKKNKECIYNILIMEEKQTIIALGAGAVSKMVFKEHGRIERVDNVKNVDIYIERIDDMIEKKKKFFVDTDISMVVQ